MVNLRRMAAVFMLAAVAILGGAASASADCLHPPVVQNPWETDAGQIDPGPTHPTGSQYSQFGYGGLDVIRYESTVCVAGVPVSGRPGTGVAGMVYGVGKWAAAGITAVTVALAREAFTDGPLWQMVRGMFSPLTSVFPPGSFQLVSTLTVVAAVTAVVWQARDGSKAGWAVHRYASIAAIAVAAAACYSWSAAIPDAWGKTAGLTLTAVQDLTTGQSGSADVAVGDALTTHILMPMWAQAQLGSDQSAIDAYAWRLRAASTLTRAEADQVRTGQTTYDDIVAAKNADYRKVAAEMKTSHPAAYAHLSGQDTTGRAWTGILGAGVAASAAAVLAAALTVVAVGKVAVSGFVHGFPLAAAFLMWPRLHRAAGRTAVFVWHAFLASIVAVFVFVAWMLGPVHGLMASADTPMTSRFAGLALVYVVLWVAWKMRGRALEKMTARSDVKTVLIQDRIVAKQVARKRGNDDDELPRGDATDVEPRDEAAGYAPFDEPAPVDDERANRDRFTVVAELVATDRARGESPPVDDPDQPSPTNDTGSDEAERAAFRDRAEDRFTRMENEALEAHRNRQEETTHAHISSDA